MADDTPAEIKMSGAAAEDAARVVEELLRDLEELREYQKALDVTGTWTKGEVGMRIDVTEARVTLLNMLSLATQADLYGEDAVTFIRVSETGDGAVNLGLEFHPPYNHHDEAANPLPHNVAVSMATHAASLLTGDGGEA